MSSTAAGLVVPNPSLPFVLSQKRAVLLWETDPPLPANNTEPEVRPETVAELAFKEVAVIPPKTWSVVEGEVVPIPTLLLVVSTTN